jgi:hypothetical protein
VAEIDRHSVSRPPRDGQIAAKADDAIHHVDRKSPSREPSREHHNLGVAHAQLNLPNRPAAGVNLSAGLLLRESWRTAAPGRDMNILRSDWLVVNLKTAVGLKLTG